jgi:hypothetical protein
MVDRPIANVEEKQLLRHSLKKATSPLQHEEQHLLPEGLPVRCVLWNIVTNVAHGVKPETSFAASGSG